MTHFLPSILSIAAHTFKGFTRNRIFFSIFLFSLSIILFAYAISTLTVVESNKVLLDFSLAAVSFCGILISIFLGTISIAREIETKAIYTVISKPISRTEYVLGKYLGCVFVLILSQVILSLSVVAILLVLGSDKGLPDGLFGCFYLMLLESFLILALSILASLSSSSALSASITILFFLVGRNSYIFKELSEKAESEVGAFFLRALYDVMPNLDRFNVRELVAYYKPYTNDILSMGSLYTLIYGTLFLSVTSILFLKKDLS